MWPVWPSRAWVVTLRAASQTRQTSGRSRGDATSGWRGTNQAPEIKGPARRFTDISGLFVINNESGWYEGWMTWDLRVPAVAPPLDGTPARFSSVGGTIPGNTVSWSVSIGAFNAQQQSDVHAYWEFNRGTNWVFPHYELPFTGGLRARSRRSSTRCSTLAGPTPIHRAPT